MGTWLTETRMISPQVTKISNREPEQVPKTYDFQANLWWMNNKIPCSFCIFGKKKRKMLVISSKPKEYFCWEKVNKKRTPPPPPSVRNVRWLLHEVKIWSCNLRKSKRFQIILHATFLPLQVFSIFHPASNMNGFFYHLFSVIYASLFFAVHFVVTFERLTKHSSFCKWFTAAIQDHISKDK